MFYMIFSKDGTQKAVSHADRELLLKSGTWFDNPLFAESEYMKMLKPAQKPEPKPKAEPKPVDLPSGEEKTEVKKADKDNGDTNK